MVAALLLTQAPLGFVAILGVTALSGMIMRNSVILIDQVQTEMDIGGAPWNAVLEAAVHRTRPVMLTATAAVLAMIPLTRSVFWGAMAIAIMGGLTVATLLTIFCAGALCRLVQGRTHPCARFRLRTVAGCFSLRRLAGREVSLLLLGNAGRYLVEPAMVLRVVSISRY